MQDWNVVVSIYQDGFRRAVRALEKLAPVTRSPYYNVLLMCCDDPMTLLDTIERISADNPAIYDAISRVAPAQRTFAFHTAEEFRERARAVLHEWTDRLAGCSFHARLHRRGRHAELPTPETEKWLDDALLALTAGTGKTCRISFTDPDAVIVFDTVDDRAGASLWTRDDLARHRLLKPD